MKKILKNKKTVITIILIIGIILLVIGIAYMVTNNKKNEVQKRIESVNKLVMNGASKKELLQIIKSEKLENSYIMMGPDSYMGEKPNSETINKYNLQKYESEQQKLSKNVENKIKKTFEYSLDKEVREDNNGKVYSGLIKTYYQIEYLLDLQELQKLIINEKIFDTHDSNEILEYKAKIIAMKCLDKYLDEYDNKDQYSGFTIYVYEDEEKSGDAIVSYLNMLQGINYHNKTITKLEETRQTRLEKYLAKIKNENLIYNFENN